MKKVIVSMCLLFTIFIINNRVYAYKSYKIGDEVTYNNIDFYVIKDSSSDEEIVTLLKAEPLTVKDVNTYGEGHINNYSTQPNDTFYQHAFDMNGFGGISYYTSEQCGLSSTTNCFSEYSYSDVKYVIDNWSNSKFDFSFIKTTRLITFDELTNNLGFEYIQVTPSQKGYKASNSTPSWVYDENKIYWTMSNYEGLDNALWIIDCDVLSTGNVGSVGNYYLVRPVVELYKCAIDDNCVSEESIVENDDNKSQDNKVGIKQESKDSVKVKNTLKSVS